MESPSGPSEKTLKSFRVPPLDLSASSLLSSSSDDLRRDAPVESLSEGGCQEDSIPLNNNEMKDANSVEVQGLEPHSSACLIMAVARTLMSSGILSAIRAGISSSTFCTGASGGSISAAHLHHLTFRAVIYHWELIVTTMRARLPHQSTVTAKRDVSVSHSVRDVCIVPVASKRSRGFQNEIRDDIVKISVGSNGRQLVAIRDIAIGEVILREKPYAIRRVLSCECSFEGTVMAEHVDLAWQMAKEELLGRTGIKTSTILSTGTSGDLMINEAASSRSVDPFVVNQWSPSTMTFLAVVSCICSICDSVNDSKPESDDTSIEQRAYIIFEILTRLPQNCHAIHSVASDGCTDTASSPVTFEVSQRRLAIGLFLRASASNHACDPNCCTRFNLEQVRSENLTECILEIVALKSIKKGEECTISYGVAAGSEDYATRQAILKKQYLFECKCCQCKESRSNEAGAANTSIDMQMRKYFVARRLMQTQIDKLKKANNFEYSSQCERIEEMFRAVGFDNPSGFEGMKESLMGFVKLKCEYLDVCALRNVNEGNYSKALRLVQTAIDLMLRHGLYTESDSPIGRERVKLAQLYHALGDYKRAMDEAQRAAQCLQLYTTINDPDMNTLRKIVEDCELNK